jgi:hypothetical protein
MHSLKQNEEKCISDYVMIWGLISMMTNEPEQDKGMYIVCTALLLVSFMGILFLYYPSPDLGGGITGFAVVEQQDVPVEPELITPEQSVTREQALTLLMRAEDDVEEMNAFGLSTLFVQDRVLQAQRFFIGEASSRLKEDKEKEEDPVRLAYLESLLHIAQSTPVYEIEKIDYAEVMRVTTIIRETKEQAYQLLDRLTIIEEKEKVYQEEKIDTSVGKNIVEKARTAFNEERYTQAEQELERSRTEHTRAKELAALSKSFFMRHWWKILVFIIVISVSLRPVVKRVRRKMAKNRWERLQVEIETTTRLLKKAQSDCFKEKKITVETYKIREERYRKRIAEIKHTLPVLEAIVRGEKKPYKPLKQRRGIIEVKK